MTNNQSLFQRPRKNRTFHVMALLYVASMGIFLPVIFAFDLNMLFHSFNVNITNVIREIIEMYRNTNIFKILKIRKRNNVCSIDTTDLKHRFCISIYRKMCVVIF